MSSLELTKKAIREIYDKIQTTLQPRGAQFLGRDHAKIKFLYAYPEIGKNETASSEVHLPSSPSETIYVPNPTHASDEIFNQLSPSLKYRAIIRSIPFSSKMPPNTPKAGDENVVYLEVFEGLKIIDRVVLSEEYGKLTTNQSVSSGLVWSPDEKAVFWIASTVLKQERDSILGFKVKMFEEKDYGEDLDGIYRTVVVMRSISAHTTKIVGAPDGYGVCGISSVSPNTLILRAVDCTNPVLLGLRSYTNRVYHLFGVHLPEISEVPSELEDSDKSQPSEEKAGKGEKAGKSEEFIGKFTQLRDEVFPEFSAKAIGEDGKKAKVFGLRFPKDFGGHDGPMYPSSMVVDLEDENCTVSQYKEYPEALSIASLPIHPFINDNLVVFNIEDRNLVYPVVMNLDTMELLPLAFLTQMSIKNESCFVTDTCKNRFLLSSGSIDHFYRVSFFDFDFDFDFSSVSFPGTQKYTEKSTQKSPEKSLEKSTQKSPQNLEIFGKQLQIYEIARSSLEIPNCQVELVRGENYCDAILAIVGDGKEWLIMPHGGPHAMWSTYTTFRYASFLLAGFSCAFVNFRGSTGQPFAVQAALPGHCGETDVEDECAVIQMIKKRFPGCRIGHWGFSHGGFLGCHMAGRHSAGENRLVEYVIVGGPIANLISSHYTADIPDWSIVEAGASKAADCSQNVDEEVLMKMWNCSPIKYVDGVEVPMLLIHGHCDRRVYYKESIQWYYALKKSQKKVCLLMYDNNGHSFMRQDAAADMTVSSILFALDPLSMCE